MQHSMSSSHQSLVRSDFKCKKVILLLSIIIIPNLLLAQDQSSGFLSFAGRLHPMIVHFPIVLLIAALVFELIDRKRKTDLFHQAIRLLVFGGMVSSFLSVAFGLALASSGAYGDDQVSNHQWTGIITSLFSLITVFAYRMRRESLAFILLIISVISVFVTGHLGGELTHGEGYLTGGPQQPDEEEMDGDLDLTHGVFLASLKTPLSEDQVQGLNLRVRSILAHNCYSCHGAGKVKGMLRLDSKEAILEGGEHGPVLVAGKPEESELIRRVTLPRGHKEAMPVKGKPLTAEETDILRQWIKMGAPWPTGPLRSLYRVASLEPRLPNIPTAKAGLEHPIDRFVDVYFDKKGIEWPESVDDRTYYRRVSLDITGLLPHPDSLDRFANDRDPGKRNKLVDNLLSSNHDYAQHWLTFWNDVLRNDYSGPGYITRGRFDITRWLYASLQNNKPYDRFVRELIDADSSSEGFIRGIRWRGEVNASQRVEMQAAQNVSQVFFGLNLKCASCHDSFISDWKLDDAYSFANLFADSMLQIYRCDKPTGRNAGTRMLFPALGKIDSTADRAARLKQLADLTVQPSNGRLYRTLVNRVWAQVMGRGIIEPVDAMDNKPWSQDLLDWLAWDFVQHGSDIKHLLRQVLTSRTYQLPSVTLSDPEAITSKDFVFRGMLRRRISAEQFADAVGQTLHPLYADSMIAWKRLPNGIQYCAPFTRASLVMNDPFQRSLGRPTRENVSTSRVSQASLLQALELTNGGLFHETIKTAAVKWSARHPDPKQLVAETYRRMFGRLPAERESELLVRALGKPLRIDQVEDFFWSMSLHPEFQLVR
jgi:uncharacterized membrane protein/mono/diheme cytochrome c family protein